MTDRSRRDLIDRVKLVEEQVYPDYTTPAPITAAILDAEDGAAGADGDDLTGGGGGGGGTGTERTISIPMVTLADGESAEAWTYVPANLPGTITQAVVATETGDGPTDLEVVFYDETNATELYAAEGLSQQPDTDVGEDISASVRIRNNTGVQVSASAMLHLTLGKFAGAARSINVPMTELQNTEEVRSWFVAPTGYTTTLTSASLHDATGAQPTGLDVVVYDDTNDTELYRSNAESDWGIQTAVPEGAAVYVAVENQTGGTVNATAEVGFGVEAN